MRTDHDDYLTAADFTPEATPERDERPLADISWACVGVVAVVILAWFLMVAGK